MTVYGASFVGPVAPLPPLAKNASAEAQLGRLLDALLILDHERGCAIADLAVRVGLAPGRLRELLVVYMIAGADAGIDSLYTVDFGTARGVLDTSEDEDSLQADADWVYVSDARPVGRSLVDDVGRVAMEIDDVVAGLLAVRHLLAGESVSQRHLAPMHELESRLSEALAIRVEAELLASEATVRDAVARRCVLRLTYRDPLTTRSHELTFAPYEVYFHRDRLVVDGDAGSGLQRLEVAGIIAARPVGAPESFQPPTLPAPAERFPTVTAVVRVPSGGNEERRLVAGWAGHVVGRGEGTVDVEISVDDPAAERLGILVLRLGPLAQVVSPEYLRSCMRGPAERMLAELEA